jgi:hypothetical protein
MEFSLLQVTLLEEFLSNQMSSLQKQEENYATILVIDRLTASGP